MLSAFYFALVLSSLNVILTEDVSTTGQMEGSGGTEASVTNYYSTMGEVSGGTSSGMDETTTGTEETSITDEPISTTTNDEGVDKCSASEDCNEGNTYCSKRKDCICIPSHNKDDNGTCIQSKKFGGILYLVSSQRRKKRSTELEVEEFLYRAYNSTEDFVNVNVFDLINDKWNYEVIYKSQSNITDQRVKEAFEKFLNDEGCFADSCLIGSLSIDNEESVKAAGTSGNVICDYYNDYCDQKSTNCRSSSGLTECQCQPDFTTIQENYTSCAKIFCSENSQCNSPHGRCDSTADDNVGRCKCNFGFDGLTCKNPAVLIIVVVLVVVVAIVAVAVIVVLRRRSSKKSHALWMDDVIPRSEQKKGNVYVSMAKVVKGEENGAFEVDNSLGGNGMSNKTKHENGRTTTSFNGNNHKNQSRENDVE